MTGEKRRLLLLINILGDLFILVFSFVLAYILIWNHFRPGFLNFFLEVSFTLIACWLVAALFFKLYSTEQFGRPLTKYFRAVILCALLMAVVVMLVKDFNVSRMLFIWGYFLFVFFDTLIHLAFSYLVRRENAHERV